MYYSSNNKLNDITHILDKKHSYPSDKNVHFDLFEVDYDNDMIQQILSHYQTYGIKSIYIITPNNARTKELKSIHIPNVSMTITSIRKAHQLDLKEIPENSLIYIEHFEQLPQVTTNMFYTIRRLCHEFTYVLGLSNDLKQQFSTKTVEQCAILSGIFKTENSFLKTIYKYYDIRQKDIDDSIEKDVDRTDKISWMTLQAYDDKINKIFSYPHYINESQVNSDIIDATYQFLENTIHVEVIE